MPHLEALLLFWSRNEPAWSIAEMAEALYISQKATAALMTDLEKRKLIRSMPESPGRYAYDTEWDVDGELMGRIAVASGVRPRLGSSVRLSIHHASIH